MLLQRDGEAKRFEKIIGWDVENDPKTGEFVLASVVEADGHGTGNATVYRSKKQMAAFLSKRVRSGQLLSDTI